MGVNPALMWCPAPLHTLEPGPTRGKALGDIVREVGLPERHQRYPYGYHGLRVISHAHADYDQIVSVGRNSGRLLGGAKTIQTILAAAVALSQTTNAAERRRLFRIIGNAGRLHAECYPDPLAEDK